MSAQHCNVCDALTL